MDTLRRLFAVAGLVSVVAVCSVASATASHQSGVAGTWAGSYHGAFSGRFTLNWKLTGGTLKGTITLSNPPGRYGITGFVGRGGAIRFGVVKVGATYTGSVSGSSMSGKYRTPQGGGSWSARKTA
jgi:hypothetical protein